MKKITCTEDVSGRALHKGDTVTTVNGFLTSRICDIAEEDSEGFVRLRPLHQPYGKGVWHAAERVMWVADAKKRSRGDRKGRPEPASKK